MHQLHRIVAMILLFAVPGCWSLADPSLERPRSGRRITADELRAVSSGSTVHAFIQRAHPGWLRPRGGRRPPNVFLDNVYLGGVESLRDIRPGDIERISYLPDSETTVRFGSRLPGAGAILLERRR